ncbi:MAG: hypothetical protein QOE35_3356 [Actinomycetota bacterium]
MSVLCTYVLPLRHADASAAPELGAYLADLVDLAQVVVVDGSAPEVFAAHRAAFPHGVIHLPVDADLTYAFGKVNGVLTGLRRAEHEAIVIADDDVRYSAELLARLVELLDHVDVVRPQNVFTTLPWHARWDTARALLNRVAGADWPGTLAVRRSVLRRAGGYDGDCLFENLELVRTVLAVGGRTTPAPWLYVPRTPPDASHFWSQRVRQAYDSFAQPWRLAAELAALPTLLFAACRWGPRRTVAAAGALAVSAAEVGRRRHGGRRVFRPTAALWAPAWIAERAITAWLAVASRVVLGGVPYGGTRLRTAAHSTRHLRTVLTHRQVGTTAEGPHTNGAPHGRTDPTPCHAVEGERMAGDTRRLGAAAGGRRHQGEGHLLRA